jgi:DNA-binding transcriptional MerR regulator
MDLFEKDFTEIALKSINEVAELLDIEPYILRFWESRFAQIDPTKGKGGRRLYSDQDVETLTRIKNLLYKQGFTIEGAKKALVKVEDEPVITDNKYNLLDDCEINEIITDLKTIQQELNSL